MININAVLEYQSIDTEIRKLEADIDRSEFATRAREAQGAFKAAKERAAVLDKEAENYLVYFNKAKQFYEENSKKIVELGEKIKSDPDNVDFEKLKGAILAMSDYCVKIDKDLSDILRKQDEISQAFSDANKQGAQAKRDFNANKESLDKLKQQKAPELEALRKKRAELEAKLEPAIRDKYHALRKDKQFLPFVPLENPNKCSGCRTDMALDKLAQLKEQGYASCEFCGRVVYKK